MTIRLLPSFLLLALCLSPTGPASAQVVTLDPGPVGGAPNDFAALDYPALSGTAVPSVGMIDVMFSDMKHVEFTSPSDFLFLLVDFALDPLPTSECRVSGFAFLTDENGAPLQGPGFQTDVDTPTGCQWQLFFVTTEPLVFHGLHLEPDWPASSGYIGTIESASLSGDFEGGTVGQWVPEPGCSYLALLFLAIMLTRRRQTIQQL